MTRHQMNDTPDMDMPLPEPVNDAMPPLPEKSYLGDDVSYGYEPWDMHAYARAYAAAEVAKERERICAAIMAKHEAANGQHNLYHCLAVELFGDEAIRAAAPPQCTSAPSEPQ